MSHPLLEVLESYYDAAPRPSATTEEVGPFTLFLRAEEHGWPYYARPRLGLDRPVTAEDVRRVLGRQRELDVPRTLEWVGEVTPSLADAVRAAGLPVRRCPLLTLPAGHDEPAGHAEHAQEATPRVRLLGADDPDLPAAVGAVGAGFAGTDTVEPRPVEPLRPLVSGGLLVFAAAYDADGAVVGGGTHNPRGVVSELTGIAVVPRARRRGLGEELTATLVADARRRGIGTVFLSAQDDAVARVYERVGFVRVGTACSAAGP